MQHVELTKEEIELGRKKVARAAWSLLLSAFLVFCASLGTVLYFGWRYYNDATQQQGGVLIVRTNFIDSITWAPRGYARPSTVNDQQVLEEGGELRIARLVGSPYGQAASVRLFDQTVFDMWAGADILLDTLRTSRWSGKLQQVKVIQTNGYVRYDLSEGQPYDDVRFQVVVGSTTIDLEPGGSYSVEVLPSNRQNHFTEVAVEVPERVDVAVRNGQALVSGRGREVTLRTGEKVAIDTVGVPGQVVAARWELIKDGTFVRYTSQEYNNTTIPLEEQAALVRSDTWKVTSERQFADDEANGYFQLTHLCAPLGGPNSCPPAERLNIANFYRCCGQTTPFLTGVRQDLDVDISEYRSLRLSFDLRILNQSLNRAGQGGVECPVTIRLSYKKENPADSEQALIWCFYAKDEEGGNQVAAEIFPQYVEPYEWYHFEDELRRDKRLPDARYLKEIIVYANGHDYNVEVTNISLIGVQDEQLSVQP
jgi:hypothetical protein